MIDSKPVEFGGRALEDVRPFPEATRQQETLRRLIGCNWGYARAGWKHEAPFGVDADFEGSYRPDGLSQSQAAKLLDVTQLRISYLMRGKIGLFGLDTLVNVIGATGLLVEMRISDAA
jgi:hypothetical protein